MTTESFQQEFLKTHNAYRAKHSAPALKLNAGLNASAQSWANHLLATGALEHSNTEDGENLYQKTGSALPTGKVVVDKWYGEIKDYNWSKPGSSSNTGHFTQVVWKDSTELGVGMASDGKKTIVVGKYREGGNLESPEAYEQNVLPLV